MVVWCTQNAPRWQQFLVAPAMPVLVHHFSAYSETRYKKLFTHVESHASAVSLLNSGEQRYIKAISTEKKQFSCMPVFSCMTERKQRVSLYDSKETKNFPARLKGNKEFSCMTERKQNIFLHN